MPPKLGHQQSLNPRHDADNTLLPLTFCALACTDLLTLNRGGVRILPIVRYNSDVELNFDDSAGRAYAGEST